MKKKKKIFLYNSELQCLGEIGCSYEGKDIETFIDDENKCFIIISGNGLNNYTKSYLLFEKNYYQIYKKKNHYPLKNIIEKINEKLVLIESSIGYVVIFDFHKGDIINIIKTEEDNIEEKSIILELCLWNENYLLCGNDNGEIFIFDINDNKIILSIIS
jgi:WD40 repeat protein